MSAKHIAILQQGNPEGDNVLRAKALTVPVKDITSPQIKKIIEDMKIALASQDDGVAIAAPQIGQSLQIFVVSGKALSLAQKNELHAKQEAQRGHNEENDNVAHANGTRTKAPAPGTEDDLVFINPRIINLSREKEHLDEGCLSVRYLYGKVRRSKKAKIQAYDENGKKVERGASGLLAQIFQHEIDHLEGILFIDKAQNVEEVLPEHLAKK